MLKSPIKKKEKESLIIFPPKLKLIQGGKTDHRLALGGGGFPPKWDNWLIEMDIGTMFLCAERTSAEFVLTWCKVQNKTESSVQLLFVLSDRMVEHWVHPVRFCQKHICHEILGIIRKGVADGGNNRL